MEDTKMKKEYINPNMNVVTMKMAQHLLNGSDVKTGGKLGGEYTSTDVSYGREFDFTDED